MAHHTEISVASALSSNSAQALGDTIFVLEYSASYLVVPSTADWDVVRNSSLAVYLQVLPVAGVTHLGMFNPRGDVTPGKDDTELFKRALPRSWPVP